MLSHFRYRCCLTAAGCVVAVSASAAPVVWTGLTTSFSKTTKNPIDRLTDHVAWTRAFTGGLYNVNSETVFDFAVSPADTEWATDRNNTATPIAAANWANLHFDPWSTAYGPQAGMHTVGRDAVVHLISDDVYLDLRFTEWQMGGGGGAFAYLRSGPTGDYNSNGVVGAADNVVWRDTLGQTAAIGHGADGYADGTIDADDHSFWMSRFGNIVAAHAAFTTLPEPTIVMLLLIGCSAMLKRGLRT